MCPTHRQNRGQGKLLGFARLKLPKENRGRGSETPVAVGKTLPSPSSPAKPSPGIPAPLLPLLEEERRAWCQGGTAKGHHVPSPTLLAPPSTAKAWPRSFHSQGAQAAQALRSTGQGCSDTFRGSFPTPHAHRALSPSRCGTAGDGARSRTRVQCGLPLQPKT